MSNRKDNKGRVLHRGEGQRPDGRCSRMARAGMSPAKLRYIMGHSDINTTYNVYTYLGLEDNQDEMLAIEQNRR